MEWIESQFRIKLHNGIEEKRRKKRVRQLGERVPHPQENRIRFSKKLKNIEEGKAMTRRQKSKGKQKERGAENAVETDTLTLDGGKRGKSSPVKKQQPEENDGGFQDCRNEK